MAQRRLEISIVVTFVFSACYLISVSLANAPPIGDFNCQQNSCDFVICTSTNCSFGKLFDNPKSQCGCCKLCITYIGENEICGANLNNRECGPGLVCEPNDANSEYRCVKMDTACFHAQADYDARRQSGKLGMYETRPSCDANGDFTGRRCQPGGSCYCVDRNNNRIFGESSATNALNDVAMNCECTRAYQSAMEQNLFKSAVQFPHCLPNGNYDTLQCVNQACFCVNSESKNWTSAPVPITALTELPCYKAEIHSTNYFRPCELEVLRTKALVGRYSRYNVTVLGIEKFKCSPDGNYQAVLETETTKYCADPSGKKLENFEVDKELAVSNSMNCKCARTRYWLTNEKVAKPSCCKNGNYRPVQCRGGVCFCVDSDGNQIEIEVQANKITELSCYKENEYPIC